MPEDVPLDDPRWEWGAVTPVAGEHRGRACVTLEAPIAWVGSLGGLELEDGVIEADLCVPAERCFPGMVWRLADDANFESFFVRPHQVGNPDACQYTPVFNGSSGWQLYHGPGFWAPIRFPLDEWFTIRVVFAGTRAEVFVGDGGEPALVIGELKRGTGPGRVGIMAGGPPLQVARFAVDGPDAALLRAPAPPSPVPVPGIVPAWSVSDPFGEAAVAEVPALDPALLAARMWTRLDAEPTGLADLARVNGLADGRDTVLARATVVSDRARPARLELGFSDRATVFWNGRALYRGDDSYRTRDYRFLGSIGWWDALWVGLSEGENDLVVAVSEDFGGWGVQARFPDHAGLVLGQSFSASSGTTSSGSG